MKVANTPNAPGFVQASEKPFFAKTPSASLKDQYKQKWSKPQLIVLSVNGDTHGPNKSGGDANSRKS